MCFSFFKTFFLSLWVDLFIILIHDDITISDYILYYAILYCNQRCDTCGSKSKDFVLIN